MKKVWAFDLGASNGRLMVSSFDGNRLGLEEIHRFSNQPTKVMNRYYWDVLHIINEMKTGMSKSRVKGHGDVESLGIDSWGVDFGLLSSNGEILGNPYCYRDPYAALGLAEVTKLVGKKELFFRTGNEPTQINTLFQLYGIKKNNPMLLEQAESLLMTPNLIGYLLSGEKQNEFTISSTSQLLSISSQSWDSELINTLGLPIDIFEPIVKPMTMLGKTLPHINQEVGMSAVNIVNVAGHDTASALAALPMEGNDSVFMSCGTWVLMGVQMNEPNVSHEAFTYGFTNEGTLDGQYRLLKNNMGLWLIQQCRFIWEKEGIQTDYIEESRLIEKTKSFQTFIDPDDPLFFNPSNMVEAVQSYCRNTGQVVPNSRGEILSCILESLALKYRWVVEKLERITDKQWKKIHMGGGGIQNNLFCQYTSNATGREVIAGPVEASSIGNSIAQWIALGEFKNLKEARMIVQNSFHTEIYEPMNTANWQEAYEKFLEVTTLK
ncbi:rhamnulokinase family protein [Evansella sp. AB-rgal1]|uniref:rhamnulokinase n=1 Tax=Evansella sp. AB-rgal1 TaxID=3242696 RepID=UPI00359DC64E